MSQNTSSDWCQSLSPEESRRLSVSEMVDLHESLMPGRDPGPEMPSRTSHARTEVREETLESFKSQVETLQLELEGTKAENSRLKSDVSVLQLDLKDSNAKEKILNGRVKNLIAEGSQYKSLNEEYQAEIQQLTTEVYDLKSGAEEAQQAHTSNVRVPELDLLERTMQTQDKDFLEAVQELQEHANSLNMQNKYITEQKLALESTMNEKVHVLQVNQTKTHEQIQSLTAEVGRLESVAEQKQAEIERLNVALRSLWNKEAFLNEQVSYLTAKGEELEGVNEEKQAEIEQLTATARYLKENEDSLTQQHDSMATELSQHKSLTKSLNEKNKSLKMALHELQHLLNEAEQQIFDQDELIKKQEGQVEYNQQVVEELYTERTDLKQTICELKDQLENRQEEEVMAGAENISQELRLWAENAEKPGPSEKLRDDNLVESPAAEPRAAEGQTSSLWRYCAKGVLRLGVSVGTCAASTLIANVMLDNFNMYNINLTHPFCNLEPGVPRPF
ncbi:golgin subfamily A member 6-like protein 22 [Sparus aurata]|uniref:golgin subfamily A member 6-like protein 22 n=1 Tax=Sparus aurata TaxID=8175 RepID=UPI0011C14A48|nr:golgin subfamily A member 6-like protein 22 [Sparus aurata]